MIIIVAAIAGIARLAIQQRREQKMHLLDDFRSSLERLSNQPLPAHARQSSSRKAINNRLPFNHKKRPASPRGEWDRVAPHPEPLFATTSSLTDDRADAFFGRGSSRDEVAGHVAAPAYEPAYDDLYEHEPVAEPRRRKKREPILAGRLWVKPREPWLWTYKKKQRSQRVRRAEVEYVDFAAQDDVVYASEGNLAHSSSYGSRSPRSSRNFAGPRRAPARTSLDQARRDAAKERIEMRRRTGSRLS